MKTRFCFAAVAVLLGLTASAPSSLAEQLPRELPDQGVVPERVRYIYADTIRPRVELRRTTTADMLEFLRVFDGRRVATVTHAPVAPGRVSINVTRVSQIRLIDLLCAKAKLYWRFTPTGVEIGPRESFIRGN